MNKNDKLLRLLITLFIGSSVLFTYTFLLSGNYSIYGGVQETSLFFDINNFSKMLTMTVLSIPMICLLVIGTMRNLVSKKILFFYILFALIIIFSFYQSEDNIRMLSFIGSPDRYEGLLMWLSYGCFLMFIVSFIRDVSSVEYVLSTILIIFFVCAAIGVGQFAGLDLLKTTFFRALMSPYLLWEYTLELVPIHGPNVVYSTLANPNNASFLFSITLPSLTYWVLIAKDEKLYRYVLWGIFFFCLLGAKSSGGILGFGITATCALFFVRKLLFQRKDRLLKIIALSIFCLIPNISAILGDLTYVNLKSSETALANVTRVTSGILFENKNGEVLLKYDASVGAILFEGNGTSIDYYNNQGVITLEYPYNTFEFIQFKDKNFGYQVGKQFVKIVYKDGDYFAMNLNGNLVPTWDVETSPLITNERFGTGRGYIWSRSLPLLKETLFIGKGADSFIYYFPQDDILGKSTGLYEGPYIIIDKPHSSYIQVAFSFGLVFAGLFFGVFIAYVIYAMKLTRLKEPTTVENYIIGIGFSMIAFLVSALFYDLSVHVTPTVILMLGIGIVLLRLRREEQQAELVESETVVVELES